MPGKRVNRSGYKTRGKFKPKHTKVDGKNFDSIFESQVYLQLRAIPELSIDCQSPVHLKKKTLRFPAIYTRLDFFVRSMINHLDWAYVEAKGAISADFIRNVKYIEANDARVFERTLIVFPDQFRKDEGVSYPIEQVESLQLKWCYISDLQNTLINALNLPPC